MVKSNGNGNYEIKKWTFILMVIGLILTLMGVIVASAVALNEVKNQASTNEKEIGRNTQLIHETYTKVDVINHKLDSLIIVLNK